MRFQLSFLSSCLFLAQATNANVIQYFAGISYNNPSELFQVKKTTFILGGTGFYGDLSFTGQALNFNTGHYDQGTSYSRRTSLLPYGRIAKRLNGKTVFAVDVTEPFHSNLNWGEHSITRFASIHTYLTDVDISPKLAYSLNEKWKLGAGINFNFINNNQVDWAMPITATQSATLYNITSGSGVGFNLGLTYLINQQNILGLTYYSRIKQDTKGYSHFGAYISNIHSFFLTLPATSVISFTHIFNPKWLISLRLYHPEWRDNQYARFMNTSFQPAKHFVFPMLFENPFAYVGALRHQYTENLGLTLFGVMDNGPEQNHTRVINFPSDTQYVLGLVADYHLNKRTTLELQYAHVFSNPLIDNFIRINGQNVPFNTGKVKINADVLDLKLKIEA